MIKFLDLAAVTALHGEEIHHAVSRVVDSGWYLNGEALDTFEHEYAAYIGTDYAVGCANGLDALTLMLRAYVALGRLAQGDEVLVPSMSFIATYTSVIAAGLKPVLVDIDPTTYGIDPRLIDNAVTNKTRAILIVHLYGRCAWSEQLAEVCRRHSLIVFEDNAQAHGCRYRGRVTGSLGNAAAHSFYPGKNLGALGNGGAVTTNDAEVVQVVRCMANYGAEKKYTFKYQGINSRLEDMQAAILSAKLTHLDKDNARRLSVAERYVTGITNLVVTVPSLPADPAEWVYHIFPVRSECRDRLQRYLTENGVQTLIHYPVPAHRQPCLQQLAGAVMPQADSLARTELSLPISPAITDADVDTVIRLINNFYS